MALLMLFTLKATQDKIQIGINRDTQQKPLNKNHKATSMARTTEHPHAFSARSETIANASVQVTMKKTAQGKKLRST